MTFNLNDHVLVRLTEHGRKLHRDDYDKSKSPYPYKEPEEDEQGWSKWQLWELMRAFGPHLYNGCELPFETTIEIITEP